MIRAKAAGSTGSSRTRTDPDMIVDAAGKGFEVKYVPPRLVENLLAKAHGASDVLIQKVRSAYSGKP
jgi:hypothetical protein